MYINPVIICKSSKISNMRLHQLLKEHKVSRVLRKFATFRFNGHICFVLMRLTAMEEMVSQRYTVLLKANIGY